MTVKNLLFILGLIATVCVVLGFYLVIVEGDLAKASMLFACSVFACTPIIAVGISSGGWQALNPFSGSK